MNTLSTKIDHITRLKSFSNRAQLAKYKPEEIALDISKIANDTKVALYLDWRNNFLSIGHFSRYYFITELQANMLLDEARALLAIKDTLH